MGLRRRRTPDEPAPDGLAWPAHGRGPTPPPQYTSRARDEDLATRKPLSRWDRAKWLVFMAVYFVVLVVWAVGDNPILGYADGARDQAAKATWLWVLAGLEVLRQLHYVISERVPRWHGFWARRVFGGLDRRTERMSSWTRFRIARLVKWSIFLTVVAVLVGKLFDRPPLLALLEVPARFVSALPLVLQFGLLFFVIIIQFLGMAWYIARQGIEVYYPDDIKTRFTDVWGQDPVLDKIKENIVFLEDPESIEERGGYVPAGILLWGPPGTGKTLMAEAVAGETGKPYVFVDPGGMTSLGFGPIAVKGLFRRLRKLSGKFGGVIVFFDEADSLGNRGQMGPQPGGARGMGAGPFAEVGCHGPSYLSQASLQHVMRAHMADGSSAQPQRRRVRDGFFMMGGGGGGGGMLQALLTEMSGLKKPRGFFNRVVRRAFGWRPKPPPKYRILVMMATNMPGALDEALLRPGRIDRIYKVGYPSKAGRIRTYEGYLAKVRHELTQENLDKLATITPYATGATIKDLVNEALINTIREGRDTITWRDVIKAKQLKELGPPDDVEYIQRERHAVAVHEACHAVIAYRMRQHMTIDIATIEKGSDYLGMVASIPPEDQFTQWRSEYEADIMVSLASLAGERMFFDGDNSSGVSGDLDSATMVATFMEGYWGMGSTVSSHQVTRGMQIGGGGGGKPDDKRKKNEELLKSLGDRIEANLKRLLAETEVMLAANRTAVLAVAHGLETHKTLTGADIEAIIEGRQGPLVDGRVYAARGFAREAEAYHKASLAAHKGHSGIELALPVLTLPEEGPTPRPVRRAASTRVPRTSGNGRNGSAGNGTAKRGTRPSTTAKATDEPS